MKKVFSETTIGTTFSVIEVSGDIAKEICAEMHEEPTEEERERNKRASEILRRLKTK